MPSGDQINGGDYLRIAGNEPQRLVVVVGLGVAGNVADDELGGRRSRVRMISRLRCTGGRAGGGYGLLVLH